MKFYLILATALLVTSATYAQNRVVYGNLTAYNSFPVMNVEVTSKKAKATTMSDSLGNFSIVCLEKDVVMRRNAQLEEAGVTIAYNCGVGETISFN